MKRKKFLLAGFGIMPFEMAVGRENSSYHKVRIGSISARLGILMAMVDDILDNDALTVTHRRAFLTNVYCDLLEGSKHHSVSDIEEVSYWIAQLLFRDFFSFDACQRAKPVFAECVTWLNRQHTEYDPESLLRIEQGVGGSSCETIPILSEIEMEDSFPAVRKAARFLGSAGQLLDDWSDIDVDLHDRVNTFATRLILMNGDTPTVRLAIKERYFGLADDLIHKGYSVLESDAQKRIYRLMSAIVDARYR